MLLWLGMCWRCGFCDCGGNDMGSDVQITDEGDRIEAGDLSGLGDGDEVRLDFAKEGVTQGSEGWAELEKTVEELRIAVEDVADAPGGEDGLWGSGG